MMSNPAKTPVKIDFNIIILRIGETKIHHSIVLAKIFMPLKGKKLCQKKAVFSENRFF